MKEFDEWWDRVPYSLIRKSANKKLAREAFRAGLLAAADIADTLRANWYGDIGKGACIMVESAIRKAADE